MSLEVEVTELTKWEKRLLSVIKDKAPKSYIKLVRTAGNLARRNIRNLTPRGETGNLKRSYRLKKINNGEIMVYTKAPHAHLVENGHKMVVDGKLGKGGRVVGFVPGKHYFRKGLEKTESQLQPMLKDFIHELGKELGMDVSG